MLWESADPETEGRLPPPPRICRQFVVNSSQQELEGDPLERILGFDHHPVPAVREDVQLGVRDQAHRDHRHVRRALPVVATPGQQSRHCTLPIIDQ